MQAAFRSHPDYLETLVSGKYSYPLFCALIDRIDEESRTARHTNILIDTFRMEGMPAAIERFYLGQKAAEILRPPYVVLLLAEAHKIDKFGETVARNRGAILLSTSDKTSGLAWLLVEAHRISVF